MRYKVAEDLLTKPQIELLQEAFEDGGAAEALSLIMGQYIPQEILQEKLHYFSRIPEFWMDILSPHFLAIKVLYSLLREHPELDINKNMDTSVIYWANQIGPILSKIVADRS